MRSMLLFVVFLDCWIVSHLACGEMPTGSDRPNILLIVADDLGFSDLGCYGGEIATPNLDRLANNGLRMTRFYTTGRCCPSRASILTGQYPHRAGLGHMVKDLGAPGYRGVISDRCLTIAEALRIGGYRTFIAGKWHLGVPDPTTRGFEEFYGTLVSAKTFWQADHMLRLPKDRKPRSYAKGKFYATDAVTDHAIDFLKLARQTPQRPWFLYLAYHAPHFPLQAPRESIAKYVGRYDAGWDELRTSRFKRMKSLGILTASDELTPRSPYWDYGEVHSGLNPAWQTLPAVRRADLSRRMSIYAAMVDRLDENIGRVIGDLKNTGELNHTLIVFLSDNGACAEWDPHGFDIKSSPQNILHRGPQIEDMGKPGTFHSVGSGWANASNTPWRLYKHYNHEGGISSPLIVHWPDGLARNDAFDRQPAHLIDLFPTVLEASRLAYPGRRKDQPTLPLPGQSLLPQWQGRQGSPRTLFFEHEGNRAVHQGRWKLSSLKGQDWELYDMHADRSEMQNLAKQRPNFVKTLSAAWRLWAAANHVTPQPSNYGVNYLRSTGNSSKPAQRE